MQCRKRWKEYHNNHKNGNHFLNARLENYLLVSDPTYRLGEQREDREEKKHTHTNQSKSAAAANRKTKAACTLHTQMTLYKFTTHQMRCFFCWLTFYELHQRRRLFEEDEKKTLEMKRAAIDIVEQRL